MKNTLILAFLFILTGSAFATEKKVDSKITGVTVYPIGAMVSRAARVNMNASTEMVVLDNLTHAIDPNTVQVGGTGDFQISSVKFETFYPYANSKPKEIKVLEDSLQMLRDKRFILEAENASLDQEKQLILANKKIAGVNSTLTVTQLDAMAKYYRTRMANIAKEKLRNQNERVSVNIHEKRIRGNLTQMNNYKYEQVGRIYVEVKCTKSTVANFKFSYFTHLASWFPKYNIKAKTGSDNIDVDYNAYVTQSTGIDWKNVDLTLSTSRPTYNNQKPELHPWYLDYYNAMKISGSRSDAGAYYVDGAVAEDMAMESTPVPVGNSIYKNGKYETAKKAKRASYTWGEEVINAMNTSYKIGNKYSVMSESTRKQVFIKNIKIPAMYNHYAVPSMEKEAFLTASIADWGSYDLIPGNATLFYNNTYVGKTYINSNTTDDTLQISLGRDQGVIVNQEKKRDLCTTKKIGSNVKKNFVYEITVKNTNREEVTIVIMDRVPVSRRSDIVVTLGNLEGAEFNKETGILKWKKTIPAGGKIIIQFDYEVKYPKNKQVNL